MIINPVTHTPESAPVAFGTLRLSPTSCVAFLHEAGVVGGDHLLLSLPTLLAATCDPDCPLLWGERVIGTVRRLCLSSRNSVLLAFFTISQPTDYDSIFPEGAFFAALPRYRATILECRTCQGRYETGDTACLCLPSSPCLALENIRLEAVTIYDTRHEHTDEFADARPALMSGHFEGVMAGLEILASDASEGSKG